MDVDGLRQTIALACRILAHRGLCEDILGHVSARVDNHRVLVRCRGPHERGLLFTTVDDIRLLDLDDEDSDPGDGYRPPNELPIHAELFRQRPDVNAVVHAHPPNVIAADLAGIPLVPMVGAYNIPAARLAANGIPVFPRSVLINSTQLGKEMTAAMSDRLVCVLRGHGITTIGATVEEATAHALNLDSLAAIALKVGQPKPLPGDDLASLPDLGAGFNDQLLWRHHVARLEHAGLSLQ